MFNFLRTFKVSKNSRLYKVKFFEDIQTLDI